MFNRVKGGADEGDQQTSNVRNFSLQPEDKDGRPVTSTPAAVKAFPSEEENSLDYLLRRLDHASRDDNDDHSQSLQRIADEASEQAEALRTTAGAQKEAERMLARATKDRDKVAAQASAVLFEAKEAAARLQAEAESHAEIAKKETQNWVAEQREAVAAVVAEVKRVAKRDADKSRADSKSTAMAEASREARKYVSRATAIGTRDAEGIRAQARGVLDRSAKSVTEAHATMQEFSTCLADFLTTMGNHLETMDGVLAEATASLATAEALREIEVDDASWEASGLAKADPTEKPAKTEGAAVEGIEEAAADETVVGVTGDPDSDSKQDLEGNGGRPLGSLFRNQDNS